MNGEQTLRGSGFTLIEVIVTIVIVAILAAMILTFLSKSFVSSGDPITTVKNAAYLSRVMANITADYNKYPKWRSSTTYSQNSIVVPTIRNGKYYVCNQAGMTGYNEPNWSSIPINDGSAIWAEGGSLPPISALYGSIGADNTDQNNAYGIYHVEENRYILFDTADSEINDGTGSNKILKVTISNVAGGRLTAVFVSS